MTLVLDAVAAGIRTFGLEEQTSSDEAVSLLLLRLLLHLVAGPG